MKSVNTFIVLTLTLLANPAWAATTAKLRVDGLVCAFCGAAIEKKLRANSATADVLVSLENKIVAVRFKDNQDISDQTLKALVNDAGYEVKSIERNNESIDDLRKNLKATKGDTNGNTGHAAH
jgi:mercuric ion binding protein